MKIMKHCMTYFPPVHYLVIRSISVPNFLLNTLFLYTTLKEWVSFNILRPEKLNIKPQFTAEIVSASDNT
jgi:hypothetical protein